MTKAMPATDYVILGPMRGLKMNYMRRGDKYINGQFDAMTVTVKIGSVCLSQPIKH